MRINKLLLRLTALFSKTAASQVEMFYSWDQDYDFVSSKFGKEFDTQPTAFEDGIKENVSDLV